MIKRLLFACVFLLLASPVWASTHTTTDCSRAEVASKTGAATENNAIVEISSTGSPCSWTSSVTWNVPEGAILHCLSTLTISVAPWGNDGSVTIVDDYVSNSPLLVLNLPTSGNFTMYGCTVQVGSGSVKFNGTVRLTGANHSTRVYGNNFDYNNGSTLSIGFRFVGWIYGVFDHNHCYGVPLRTLSPYECVNVWHDAYGGYSNGDGSWADVTDFGSLNAMFIETNQFDNGIYADDCYVGCRMVSRYNIFNRTGTQTHPTIKEYDYRGARMQERYKNTYNPDDTCDGTLPVGACIFNGLFMSSGTAMFWGNDFPHVAGQTWSGYSWIISLHSMRRSNISYTEAGTPTDWGYSGPVYQTGTVNTLGTTVTKATGSNFNTSWPVASMIIINGTSYSIASVDSTTQITLGSSAGTQIGSTYKLGSNWDGNTDFTGYPPLDDVGRGQGDLLSGLFPNKINSTRGGSCDYTMACANPRQASEPFYEWLTTSFSKIPMNPGGILLNYNSDTIVENRNYFLGTADTGLPITFDGTSGVGSGLRSARPASTTNDVAYWSTDQGGNWDTTHGGANDGCLDIVQSGAWVNCVYTPAVNPHPLVSGCSGASKLLFSAQPSSTTIGAALGTVTVGVYDSSDVLCDTATDTITIANKGGTCTGMTLGGTASGSASSGVFTTTNLTENAAGPCTLSATASGLTGADSSAFAISAAGAGSGLSLKLRLKGF